MFKRADDGVRSVTELKVKNSPEQPTEISKVGLDVPTTLKVDSIDNICTEASEIF